MILLFCLIGTYCLNNLVEELTILLIFGGLGYLLRYFGYELAPLILAFFLGPIIEDSLRQSLTISGGTFAIFLTRPISGLFVFATAFILFWGLLRHLLPKKAKKD